jgi:hypothetical protein
MGREMRVTKLYEPVTIGVLLLLLLKFLIAAANLAGAYLLLSSKSVAGIGDVKVEATELSSETEKVETIKDVTTKRVETREYTLDFEPSYEWNSAIDTQHRPQLSKLIQEGIESTAEMHLKRKITLQNVTKQSSQIELDPSQGSTWRLDTKQEVVVGRVVIKQGTKEPIVMPFRMVIGKTLEGRPERPWWQVWKR